MEDSKEIRNTVEDKKSPTYVVLSYPGASLPKQYEAMVYSKWLRSLRYGNDYFKLIDDKAYFENYHKFIEAILSKPDTRVRLAVLSEDADIVFGFAVVKGDNVLHYIHCQRDYRKTGIGKSLLPKNFDTITHLTTVGVSIWGAKYPGVKFNPFDV